MTPTELVKQLQSTPARDRSSLENLIVAAITSGRIHATGPAVTELAQLRTAKSELLAATNALIESYTYHCPEADTYSIAVREARATIAKHGTP